MGINYGFDKVRFLNPVRPGDQVRVTGTVLDIVDKGNGRYLQKLGVSLEIQGKDKPAIVCEWLNMFVVN
jgi:acyl dehydratase